jgi:uncharacterized SAM-binding protein YcdF (DUF218 family)
MDNELLLLCAHVWQEPALPPIDDVVYLFSETADNGLSVLEKAENLGADFVAFSGSGPRSGYPGFEAWRDMLLDMGFMENQIIAIPEPEGNLNTYSESVMFAEYAKSKNWRHVLAVAPFFHLPRAMLSMISAITRVYPKLNVYSVPGTPLSWKECVVHSQGLVGGTRSDILLGEMERIATYQEKGDLISIPEALRYLHSRK